MAQTYQYAVVSNNTDQGTVSAGGSSEVNQNITVTATPKTGYAFDHWEYTGSSGTLRTASNPCSIVMPEYNVTFTAFFKKKTYTVTISGEAGGAPAFSDGTRTKTVEHGTWVSFSANPDSSHEFKEFVIEGETTSHYYSETVLSYMVTATTTITAKYQKKTCHITIHAEAGGTATFDDGTTEKTVDYGTKVNLVATPNTYYQFSLWTINGKKQSLDYFYAKEETIVVEASFWLPTRYLSIHNEDCPFIKTRVSYDSVSAILTSPQIAVGTEVTIQAIADDSGYHFNRWTINNLTGTSSVSNILQNPYTFTMPDRNVHIYPAGTDDHVITFDGSPQLIVEQVDGSNTNLILSLVGTISESKNHDILYKFYKDDEQINPNEQIIRGSGDTFIFHNCSTSVTLTESDLLKSSITFKVEACCYVFPNHKKTISMTYNPQTGEEISGGDEPGGGDDPGGDTPGGGDDPGGDTPGGDDSGGESVVVNSGYGLYYWNGTRWVGIIPIALGNGGETNGE